MIIQQQLQFVYHVYHEISVVHHVLCGKYVRKLSLYLHHKLTSQYNTILFIEDDKNKDREVSADTAATETYYMMGINPSRTISKK